VHRLYDKAKEAYRKVIGLDPRHSTALGFLGLVHHLMGDYDNAIVKYHEVCEQNFLFGGISRVLMNGRIEFSRRFLLIH
jgi:tetratricopeptide (TPR) repeat protein